MASKRKWDAFDPNKSDSDDLDYGAAADESPRPKPSRRSRPSKGAGRKPTKRRKETYDDGDEEIEVDSDDSEDSFAQSSQHEEEVLERNPRTGRSVRSVAKKPIHYEDSSDEERDLISDKDDSVTTPAAGRVDRVKSEDKSLRVILPISVKMEGRRVTRARTGSRPSVKREPTPLAKSAGGTRRSSRISHNEEDPLVALTDSGRHEQVARPGTATPEPESSRRPTRGSKGLKTVPSAILEVSQEDQEANQPVESEALFRLGLQVAGGGESEAQVRGTSPEAEEVPGGEAIAMEVVDEDEQVVQESQDEEDEAPIQRGGRSLRTRLKPASPSPSQPFRRSLRARKSGGAADQSSDFEPDPEAEAEAEAEADISDDDSDDRRKPSRGHSSNGDSMAGSRRSGRVARKTGSQRSRSRREKSDDEELDPEEIADEAADLEEDNRRNRRERKRPARRTNEIAFEPNLRNRGTRPDYRILRPELLVPVEDDDAVAGPSATPQRNRRGGAGGAYRSLFSTVGPFGGAGGPAPVFGGLAGQGATGGVDSDSSDDDGENARGGQAGVGGTAGMTPTSAFPKPFVAQTHNADPVQGLGGGPPGLGKVRDKKALADADPLGVDTNVTFEGVGGLEDHINQLKEMVSLPLLYPEVFQQFHVTPPRGVLFHGPPGTGKTLLARALASSVSSQGQKVTFYMRKGADALSKWVGEAEKQLRLLFEEARKNQPSIIFFDEIDGLAPVRSSKQEQIHASIVATLLALMDGMDGRGQVIVIGATNRPDSVDPALRRPGRFDREFYFPLPDQKARRAIIDIHTKGWEPALTPEFKTQLAELTRGYGGADLRALCTEAALNAVQGTYPQIYSSDTKLLIDPSTIKVLAKDFMISVNKIVPASERSAASGAAPLRKDVEPLLREPLAAISRLVDEAIPRKRKATALEEAMFDDRDDEVGFDRESMQRQFESARVFRPRLLIRGRQGMGQQYLGAALLSKLEGLHVSNFDMATLMKDSSRSVEAAIVQQFEEVKRHKPGVIYIPNVDIWYRTLGDSAIRTFTGLLRSLPPTEPILLLGVLEQVPEERDEESRKHNKYVKAEMMRGLFGYSIKNQFELERPNEPARLEYFTATVDYISKAPTDFPEQENRKRRKLAELPPAPPPPTNVVQEASKGEEKEQKRKDRLTLNLLKMNIQSVMDQIKFKYKKFRTPPVEDRDIAYLYDEQNPEVLTTDLDQEQRQQAQLFRPFELGKDDKGVEGLLEVASGKFYYNLEIVTIEKRLSNGYYKRPKDFLGDIKRLAKDARTSGDQERTLRANEMLSNVEVDMATLEQQQPILVAECELVYQRELERERKRVQKAREAERRGEEVPKIQPNVPPPHASKTTTENSGPVVLGQEVPNDRLPMFFRTPARVQGAWSTTGTNSGSLPSHLTNGSYVPSRPREDSEMMDSQPENYFPHRPQGSPTAAPNQPTTQGQQLSQKSAHTRVAQGSQVEQYHNSASTTTSGNKTSDKSNRSSGPYSVNTQLSNGIRLGDHPDFSMLPEAQGGSQLPDTQEQHYPSSLSEAASQASQPTMPPPQRQHSITAILNPPVDPQVAPHSAAPFAAPAPPQTLPEPRSGPATTTTTSSLILEPSVLSQFLRELVERSSGLSVEQLEQVNASMMDVIWRERGNWNRMHVLRKVQEGFNETVGDIEACQWIADPSQEK